MPREEGKKKVEALKVKGPEMLPNYPILMFASKSLQELCDWAERRNAIRLTYYVIEYRTGPQYVGAIPDTRPRRT